MDYEKMLTNARARLKTLTESSDEERRARFSEISELRTDIAHLEDLIASRRRQAEKLRDISNLGAMFSTRTFDTFDESKQPEAYKFCKRYAEEFLKVRNANRNSILLMGSCGTGKTHLAAAVVNYIIDHYGVPCLWGTWGTHLEKLQKEFNGGHRQYLDLMKQVDMLVIDDYGKRKESEWSNSVLFEVINARYEAKLPFILTTNKTASELKIMTDRAILSRISEKCSFFEVNGKDFRME